MPHTYPAQAALALGDGPGRGREPARCALHRQTGDEPLRRGGSRGAAADGVPVARRRRPARPSRAARSSRSTRPTRRPTSSTARIFALWGYHDVGARPRRRATPRREFDELASRRSAGTCTARTPATGRSTTSIPHPSPTSPAPPTTCSTSTQLRVMQLIALAAAFGGDGRPLRGLPGKSRRCRRRAFAEKAAFRVAIPRNASSPTACPGRPGSPPPRGAGRASSRRALVLCYHAVSRPTGTPPLSVTPEALGTQLGLPRRAAATGAPRSPTSLSGAAPGRTVAVTFDDAYRSVHRARLADPREIRPARRPSSSRRASPAARSRWHGRASTSWLGGPHEAELVPMSWDEARELHDAAGRSARTPSPTPADDRLGRAARRGAARSREICEEQIGAPCESIAYPYGDHDDRVVAATAARRLPAGGDPAEHDCPAASPCAGRGSASTTPTTCASSGQGLARGAPAAARRGGLGPCRAGASLTPGALRVLVLVDGLGVAGGGERFARQLTLHLEPDRFERIYCVSRWRADEADDPAARTRGRGAARRRGSSSSACGGGRRSGSRLVPLLRLLRERPADVLHSHKFGSNFCGAVVDVLAQRPPVFVAHEQTWSFEGRPVRRFLDRELIARRADAFIAVSSEDRRRMIELERIDPEKVLLMPNAVPSAEPRAGHDVRAELGIAPTAPVIGAVAVLRPQKALPVLLEACVRLRPQFPDLREQDTNRTSRGQGDGRIAEAVPSPSRCHPRSAGGRPPWRRVHQPSPHARPVHAVHPVHTVMTVMTGLREREKIPTYERRSSAASLAKALRERCQSRRRNPSPELESPT